MIFSQYSLFWKFTLQVVNWTINDTNNGQHETDIALQHLNHQVFYTLTFTAEINTHYSKSNIGKFTGLFQITHPRYLIQTLVMAMSNVVSWTCSLPAHPRIFYFDSSILLTSNVYWHAMFSWLTTYTYIKRKKNVYKNICSLLNLIFICDLSDLSISCNVLYLLFW